MLGLVLILLLFAVTVVCVLKGVRRVPLGAKGVVILLGRRTGQVKDEGLTWLVPAFGELIVIYVRERQVDVEPASYYTSDRVRISFKTTLRITVSDPAALFDQGPGTYQPFTRDAYTTAASGDEEKHVAVLRLVQNSIRECVQSLNIRDVMFGGRQGQATLRDRLHCELSQTVRRWGLDVMEIWLTDVDAENAEVRSAVESEVRESMEGRGQLAAFEAQVSKGAAFSRVAAEVVDDVKMRLGREVPVEEVVSFLIATYRNERALDVALKSAGSTNDIMQHFWLEHLGLPFPQGRAGRKFLATPNDSEMVIIPPQAVHQAPEGSWIVGREGDLRVDWDGVSRHHARLDLVHGEVTLTDLGSTNGTFVRGQQLLPRVPQRVTPQDIVALGQKVSFSVDDLIAATQSGQVAHQGP